MRPSAVAVSALFIVGLVIMAICAVMTRPGVFEHSRVYIRQEDVAIVLCSVRNESSDQFEWFESRDPELIRQLISALDGQPALSPYRPRANLDYFHKKLVFIGLSKQELLYCTVSSSALSLPQSEDVRDRIEYSPVKIQELLVVSMHHQMKWHSISLEKLWATMPCVRYILKAYGFRKAGPGSNEESESKADIDDAT